MSESGNSSGWALRLWDFDKHYQHLGDSGGAGVGYGAPAAVGAALANKKYGRLSVNIQGDGDLLYAPGVLWTAAHHRIPLLTVMHNNRAYHQEVMHIQRMANRHNRGITRAHIGTTIDNPNVDFAKIAQGMGVYAEGRSPTRTISVRRCSARSPSSRRASRRSSTSSRSRGETGSSTGNVQRHVKILLADRAARCGRLRQRDGDRADTAPAAAAAPAGNAETGKKLFVSYGCWQCHGYEGQGGAAGPRLAPRPLPFAGFSRYVRRPTNQMPPYTERSSPTRTSSTSTRICSRGPRRRPPPASPYCSRRSMRRLGEQCSRCAAMYHMRLHVAV